MISYQQLHCLLLKGSVVWENYIATFSPSADDILKITWSRTKITTQTMKIFHFHRMNNTNSNHFNTTEKEGEEIFIANGINIYVMPVLGKVYIAKT